MALILLAPLLLAASAPAQPQQQTLEQALKQARSEQASAEAEAARLQDAADRASGEAQRLQAQQAAAAQSIEAAEAQITAAEAQYRLASADVALHRARLAREQQPVSSLLAGIAIMARRPPLLALADNASADELIQVSVLLDSTLPVIRSRTAAVSAQLAQGRRLEAGALAARAELVRTREQLQARRIQFAQLEQRALQRSLAAGGEALSAGDVAIAAGEEAQRIGAQQQSSSDARRIAQLLALEEPAPQRPQAATGARQSTPFPYMLPAQAPVTEGLGAVNGSGVRSRGISFATGRGTPVSAPAAGIVRFSGPFGDYDGVLLIDHGGGWISLIVNLSSELRAGDKVSIGQFVGRAIGPLKVELSHNGQRFSPALIAGSSQTLSKAMKGG